MITGMYRTRIKEQILAEFLPPSRKTKTDRVIVLCDGMPSMPRKQPLAEFLAAKGYWVVYPRYRGAWESDGTFLARSPHLDILDVIDALPHGLKDAAFGKKFALHPKEIFVIGGSFGGPSAILCSLDARVKRVVANCPVVDWSILKDSERAETSNPHYVDYIRGAFGRGYRLTEKNWAKLGSGNFYNPVRHAEEVDSNKVIMFHAKDDPYVPWRTVADFAERTGVELHLFARGGHLSTDATVRKHWTRIERFFRGSEPSRRSIRRPAVS
jgi:pimeloyl-ACP methyl ester carboxylesterase